MDEKVVKTDRRYRRNLFSAYLLAIGIGLVLWKWGIPALADAISGMPNKERVETLEVVSHLLLLLFFPPAIYLIIIGRRICSHAAIPYPGMRVIRDTVVIKGRKALFRGKLLIILGVVMMIAAVASMTATHLILLRFKGHPLIRPVFYSVGREQMHDGRETGGMESSYLAVDTLSQNRPGRFVIRSSVVSHNYVEFILSYFFPHQGTRKANTGSI